MSVEEKLNQAKGAFKEGVGKLTGDKKTEKVSATGHQHTEIRNKKEATCKETGYSGDTWCKDCGKKYD